MAVVNRCWSPKWPLGILRPAIFDASFKEKVDEKKNKFCHAIFEHILTYGFGLGFGCACEFKI